ncbi:MAG: hypothetical protein SH818_19880 [Saprospiraceae bacterium]|nr:hypothetical protein [Saprospiraceae bacterium]
MKHIVKILAITHLTPDVLQFIVEKPADFQFTPGQATDVSINREDWIDEKRSFTITSIPNNDFLEFTIKTYPNHKGVTNQLLSLRKEDELILHDVFGDINYQDEGVFIAGGAGVTPFLSIFRYLREQDTVGNNKLIFANKTQADIIHEEELANLLGEKFINVLSEQEIPGYAHGFITRNILEPIINPDTSYVYVCGPPPMMKSIEKILGELDIHDKFIIKESF